MDFRGWISRRTGGRIDRVVDPGSTPFSCLRVSFRENSRKNARRGVSKDSGKGGGDNSRNTRPSCSGCRCSVRSLTPRHNGPTECETKIMVAACKPMNRFNTPFPSPHRRCILCRATFTSIYLAAHSFLVSLSLSLNGVSVSIFPLSAHLSPLLAPNRLVVAALFSRNSFRGKKISAVTILRFVRSIEKIHSGRKRRNIFFK